MKRLDFPMARFLFATAVVFALAAPNCWADTATAEKAATESNKDASEEKAKSSDDEKPAKSTKQESAEKKSTKVRLAQIVLASDLRESPGGSGPFGELQADLRTTILRFDRAAKDSKIDGMVLRIQNPALGRGRVNEIRAAIKRFRDTGKKVYAELEMAMPSDYLIATACDEIVMPESGMLLLPGVSLEGMFFKGLLDKIGVQADFIHMGEAKGAAEPFTRKGFSDSVRANLSALTDDLYDHMVETVAFDRPITKQQAIEAIDQGLLTAQRAKKLGLVDRLAYPPELRNSLTESYHTEKLVYVQNYGKKKVDTDFSGPTGFLKLLKLMSGGSSSSRSSGKKVAVVYAVGAITTGKSETDIFGNTSSMGSTTIVKALREAASDEDVAAIVLRINSPGGSAIASDLIWNQIQAIEKPVVASMGDVAASGGYYIAMGCDKILAEPSTITGSIGVVGGKLALSGLYDKVGISMDTISRGKNSSLFSATSKFSASERQAIRSMMEDTYEQFTSKAAAGRDMPLDQLKKLAGGKVYSGERAKAIGLIDELGTLHDAVAVAKGLAGIDADKDVKIRTLPKAPDLMESLFGGNDSEKEVEVKIDLGQFSPEMEAIARRAGVLRRVFREPVVLMMPFDLEVK